MSDDLRIPAMAGGGRAPTSTPYRPRSAGGRRIPRVALLSAGAVALALAIGAGGWAMMHRRPAVVPVIEADSRPLRIKPDNPGGMQFAGADEQVLGGQATGAERMAPTAEAPAPQALRAQMQQAAPAPTTAPPSPTVAAPATPPPAARAAGPVASPLPDTPARPAPVARTAPPPRPAAGSTMVQMAAVETEAGAQAEWQRLIKRMPELLGDRRPVMQRADRDGHAVWRVRTGGFADAAEAKGFCDKVRARGGNCAVASF